MNQRTTELSGYPLENRGMAMRSCVSNVARYMEAIGCSKYEILNITPVSVGDGEIFIASATVFFETDKSLEDLAEKIDGLGLAKISFKDFTHREIGFA